MSKTRVLLAALITWALTVGLVSIAGSASAAKPIYLPKPQHEKPLPRKELRLTSPHVPIPHGTPGSVHVDDPGAAAPVAAVTAHLRGISSARAASVSTHAVSGRIAGLLGVDGPVFDVSSPETGDG